MLWFSTFWVMFDTDQFWVICVSITFSLLNFDMETVLQLADDSLWFDFLVLLLYSLWVFWNVCRSVLQTAWWMYMRIHARIRLRHVQDSDNRHEWVSTCIYLPPLFYLQSCPRTNPISYKVTMIMMGIRYPISGYSLLIPWNSLKAHVSPSSNLL